MDKSSGSFVWDILKEWANIEKHGVDFSEAAEAFEDTNRKIYEDSRHSHNEKRFFCVGSVRGRIMTVRFIYRENKLRIIGAGYWRKGKDYYEKENS